MRVCCHSAEYTCWETILALHDKLAALGFPKLKGKLLVNILTKWRTLSITTPLQPKKYINILTSEHGDFHSMLCHFVSNHTEEHKFHNPVQLFISLLVTAKIQRKLPLSTAVAC